MTRSWILLLEDVGCSMLECGIGVGMAPFYRADALAGRKKPRAYRLEARDESAKLSGFSQILLYMVGLKDYYRKNWRTPCAECVDLQPKCL